MKKVILFLFIAVSILACKKDKVTTTNNTIPETAPIIKNTPKKPVVKKVEVPKKTFKLEEKKLKINSNVIVWKGYKPTGSHTGTITIKSADLKLHQGNLIGGTVIFDMTSIKNNDLTDAGDNADLVNHLKSSDFFNVAKYPTAKFNIAMVNVGKNGVLKIDGLLTIKGVMKNISFPATISKSENGQRILKSKAIIVDRTEFGVKYKSKKFFANLKDKFINDEFEISFVLNLDK